MVKLIEKGGVLLSTTFTRTVRIFWQRLHLSPGQRRHYLHPYQQNGAVRTLLSQDNRLAAKLFAGYQKKGIPNVKTTTSTSTTPHHPHNSLTSAVVVDAKNESSSVS